MRALVIDDSKPVRSILAKILRARDFEITEAAEEVDAMTSLIKLCERVRGMGAEKLGFTTDYRLAREQRKTTSVKLQTHEVIETRMHAHGFRRIFFHVDSIPMH